MDYIIHVLIHDLFDTVEYTLNPVGENPTYLKENKDQNGQYLGLARNTAKFNTYYSLTEQGRVITRTDARLFSAECLRDPVIKNCINTFNGKIKRPRKLNDEDDVQKAAPNLPAFDTDIVPQ